MTGETVRDTVQRILPGRVGQWGTGAIPREAIIEIVNARGVPELVSTIRFKHVSGGISTIGFKSYEAGRERKTAQHSHICHA